MKPKHLLKFALVALVLSSCAINKKAYKDSRNMAIISVCSSEKVKNNSSLQARILTEAIHKDTLIEQPAEMVKKHFYKINSGLISKIVNEKDIVESSSFQEYAQANDNEFKTLDQISNLGVAFVAAEGYPVIKNHQKETIMESFNHLPKTVDAVIVLNNHFSFVESMNFAVGGLSTAGLHGQQVQANLIIYILNRDGKKIWHGTYIGTSEGKLTRDGDFTLSELADQALAEAFMEMDEYLTGKVGR